MQYDVAAIAGIYENAESFWEYRVKNAHKRADTWMVSTWPEVGLLRERSFWQHFVSWNQTYQTLDLTSIPMAQEEAQQLLERAVQKEVIRVVQCSSIQDLEKVRDMLSDNLMLTKDGPVQFRGKYGG